MVVDRGVRRRCDVRLGARQPAGAGSSVGRIARLILLNGPPAVGKSTLAVRYAEERPLTLRLDIDVVRGLLGDWASRPSDAGLMARAMAIEMARVALSNGHDVVVPQFIAVADFIAELEALAAEVDAHFIEVALITDADDVVTWFAERPADPQARAEVGPDQLRHMVHRWERLIAARPHVRRLPARTGSIEQTYGQFRDLVEAPWVHEALEVRTSSISGHGLFATRPLDAGVVVVRLGGRLVSTAELHRLVADAEAADDYVDTIAVSEDTHLVLPAGTTVHYGNHSCEPTMWLVGADAFATCRSVADGEELTIDYGTISAGVTYRMACACGSSSCRRLVTGEDWRRIDLQQRYAGHWPPGLQPLIDEEDRGATLTT